MELGRTSDGVPIQISSCGVRHTPMSVSSTPGSKAKGYRSMYGLLHLSISRAP